MLYVAHYSIHVLSALDNLVENVVLMSLCFHCVYMGMPHPVDLNLEGIPCDVSAVQSTERTRTSHLNKPLFTLQRLMWTLNNAFALDVTLD